jgi:flagellar hook-basal body complex protein FliE
MTDPLGLIGIAGAPGSNQLPAGCTKADPNAPSFKDVLLKNLNEVNKLQQDAAKAAEDLQTGKGSLENMLIATNKADLAFKMIQGLRNQVMRAYDEIQQMRV